MKPLFSILVVCLNPGDKLKNTLQSILKQTFTDYEVIVKDGGSKDGSLDCIGELADCRIKQVCKKDTGIYDAMNQAVLEASGQYAYYLNCGDFFYDENVLAKMEKLICQNPAKHGIYYGNIFERLTGQEIYSNPKLDAFGCYRNVPCHQACFYDRELLALHPFDTKYLVRADYEQFLWCFFTKTLEEPVKFLYQDILIADYEGGGFSETKENRKLSAKEHREIVYQYMSRGQVLKYRAVMWITLAPLRTKIAQNKWTAGIYNKMKEMIYKK